jgi:O-antigen/teichoic acid export membrane protein
MFNIVQNAVVVILFPKASGLQTAEILLMVERSARIATVITASSSLLVSLIGSEVLVTLYGHQYSGNARCLRILLLEVTISGCVFVLSQAFMALGRPGIVSCLQASGLAISIPLMLVFVPRYGIEGAAASLLISTIARFILVMAGFPLILKTRLPNLIPQMTDFHLLRSLLLRRDMSRV